MFKKSKPRAGRVVKRVLADGTVREYRYGPHRKKPKAAGDSLSALIRSYTGSPEWNGLKPASRTTYLIYLRPLERLGHVLVSKLRRRDIIALRDVVASESGNGAGTQFVRTASALFGWAVDHDWIEHTPVHRVKKLPGGHLRTWTREEASFALYGLPEHMRRVVLLALHTGQRRGDLCAMTWGAYDGTSIRVCQEKQKRSSAQRTLVIPVHPDLKAALDSWRGDRDAAAPILTNTIGKPWLDTHLTREIRRYLAGLEMPADLTLHGLRKLAATKLADAGCSTHEIAAITGHRTLNMVALYTQAADQARLASAAVVKLTTHEKRPKP